MKRQSNKLWWLACTVGVVTPALVAMVGVASAEEVFTATKAITLPNGQAINGFDISFVGRDRYFLGDRTNKAVDVINTDTNTVEKQLTATPAFAGVAASCPDGNVNDCSGPDGVILIGHREVWAGDGDSSVKVIDLFSGVTTHHILTGGKFRADEMCEDKRDHLVMVANNADDPPFGSIISTVDHTVKGQIKFDGTNGAPKSSNGAEQCQWSPRTGKFYISIPGINTPDDGTGGVAVINPTTRKVETTFVIPLADCKAPQGMALGPDHQMLLGCNGANATASTVIIDERNGKTIKVFPAESGSDEVWFNPGDNHYFLARSSAVGPNQLLGVIDAESLTADPSAITNLTGKGNAHSVAADPEHNRVYVPIPKADAAGVCASAGGTPGVGCIAVFTSPNDKDCLAEGSPVISVSDEGDEDHMRESCHHHDD